MLSLYIGSKKEWVRDRDGDLCMVYPVRYEKDGDFFELRQSTSLPKLDDVEILFQWRKDFFQLPVSRKLRTAILNFMLFKHLSQDDSFNCYSFVCEVEKVPHHDTSQMFNHWNLSEKNIWSRIGEVVFFLSPHKGDIFFHHAAIHLGFGRYLSVWGGGGQFEVATLEDMRAGYRAQWVFTATPL